MAWMEIHQELVRHHKVKRLARALGVSRPEAVGHLVFLWAWAYDHLPDGKTSDFEDEEIAEEAGWDGDPAVFRSALTACGWVDPDGHLHDWEEYSGRLLGKREANRERARTSRERYAHAAHSEREAYGATEPYPTEPHLTQPNPTTPDPTEPDQERSTTPHAAANGERRKEPRQPAANAGQVPDRWPYFLGQLINDDVRWSKLTIAALRRIADETGEAAVTTALGFAAESHPKVTSSAYAWVQATARNVRQRETAGA